MRVPLYPSDLIPHRGFKLIAKAPQGDWPSAEPINLMVAQEWGTLRLDQDQYPIRPPLTQSASHEAVCVIPLTM